MVALPVVHVVEEPTELGVRLGEVAVLGQVERHSKPSRAMSFRRAMSSGFSSCCRATSDGLFKAGEEFEDDLGIERR
jgi:hypothetical protein